ncbi:TetR/AcrR family transcriptional regulator [Ruegeria sp. AU67]|uniref:TetR/AcrR family transcriptional regulator n=1 Tax=Ruegeria sp. AU67 TaxID=2108530 RepID=UPI00135C3BCE|nr:TetR/AcrR family transcriptional regulator [Ruegeria sp. AU67]
MSKTIDQTVPPGLVGRAEPVAKKTARSTGRVSKRDWLEKALEVFVLGGIEAVRVNDLARKLDVAKSGFYWHFRDRAELLEAMKHYWVDEFSRQLIEGTHSQDSTLRDRLISLVKAIRSKESGKLDLAFTAWAQTDPSIQALVDQVRDIRVAFIKELLSETGFSDAEVISRARIFVVYVSWSEVMFDHDDDGLVGEELDIVLDILIG